MTAEQRRVHYSQHGALIDGTWYPSMDRCVMRECKDATQAELAARLALLPKGRRAQPFIAWVLRELERAE